MRVSFMVIRIVTWYRIARDLKTAHIRTKQNFQKLVQKKLVDLKVYSINNLQNNNQEVGLDLLTPLILPEVKIR